MARRKAFLREFRSIATSLIWLSTVLGGVGMAWAEDAPWTSSKQELVDRINKERADHDLKILAHQKELDTAAQGHAENMAAQDKFSHELDDKNPADRAKAAGYPTRIVGETIAWQSELDPAKTVAQWMDSKIHHDILLGDYDDLGVGLARRPGGVYFWTVVVGRRRIGTPLETSK